MVGRMLKTEKISFSNPIKLTTPEPTVEKRKKRKISVALCKTLEAVVEGFSDSSDDIKMKKKCKSSSRVKKNIIKPTVDKQDKKKNQVEYLFVSPSNSVAGECL